MINWAQVSGNIIGVVVAAIILGVGGWLVLWARESIGILREMGPFMKESTADRLALHEGQVRIEAKVSTIEYHTNGLVKQLEDAARTQGHDAGVAETNRDQRA